MHPGFQEEGPVLELGLKRGVGVPWVGKGIPGSKDKLLQM